MLSLCGKSVDHITRSMPIRARSAESQPVDHERGEHVVVPVVGRLVPDLEVGQMLERGGDVLGILQGRGQPK